MGEDLVPFRGPHNELTISDGVFDLHVLRLGDGSGSVAFNPTTVGGFSYFRMTFLPHDPVIRTARVAPPEIDAVGLADTAVVLFAVRIRLWGPFVVFAAYPTIAFIRGPLRRYRRRNRGLCLHCGYDLRGTPERCPECGSEALP